MADIARAFIDQSRRLLTDSYLPRIETAVERVPNSSALLDPRQIQSYDVTVMQAIYAAVEHFSMHTGQIMLLAKTFNGDLGFYDLSNGEPRPTWKGGMAGR